MSWKVYKVIFRLNSPLHVGYRQAGILARTRPYLPGRNLWGAVTVRLARLTAAGMPDYDGVGRRLKSSVIFTYCFPALKWPESDFTIFRPTFTERGLMWGNLSHEEFHQKAITSYTATAIAHESRAAEEASLHEIEALAHRTKRGEPVFLCGYILIVEESMEPALEGFPIAEALRELRVGGEQRYGFGHLALAADPMPVNEVWGLQIDRIDQDGKVEIPAESPIWGHLECRPHLPVKGDLELLAGREYVSSDSTTAKSGPGQRLVLGKLFWVPGSLVIKSLPVRLNYDGTLDFLPP